MDGVLIDNLVVFFALVYYAVLIVLYLLRAHELTEMEWKMGPVFSALLIPFASLWVVNLIISIIYLVYDLWYRAITLKKPHHHPNRWPVGLIVYVLLLFIGSIGLNWYGFLVSYFDGSMLVVAFFMMMSSFGYYQYRYNKRKKARKSQIN